jgi:hypothetical protein
MTRFRYSEDVTPPAPFVHVKVRPLDGGVEPGWLPAQLDSAASRSVLPLRVAEEAGLVPADQIPIVGVGGHTTTMPTYLVQIEIRLLVPLTVEAVAHEDEPFVLIGRDILNQFRVLLDGPNLVAEIG